MKTYKQIYIISIYWLICHSALADFNGHENGVKSIAISDNLLLSASKDQTIKVWNINTGTEIRTCYGHNGDVTSTSFSPDATQAISGDLDGIIILWNINDCQVIHKFSNKNLIKSVSWSANGLYALSAHNNGVLKLWDINAKLELRTFTGHTAQVNDVSFSPDSSKALSASHDQTIKLWNVETGEEIRTFSGHTNRVVSVAFSKDGLFAISSSWDNTIRRWNIQTGEHTVASDQIWASDVSFVQDSNFAISGGKDQILKVWNLKTGQSICDFKGHTGTITSVAVSKENNTIFSASLDKTIKQWQMCELPKESLGKAIIIAAGGAQPSNTLFPYSNEYVQRMYNSVKQRGLTDSDVYYLNPQAPDLNDDGEPDNDLQDYNLFDPETDIEDAFAQAAKNLQAGQQFIFYIHGHSDIDSFNITPNYELSAAKFKELLDLIPAGVQQFIFIDTPYSGSFINDLAGVENRIVITSTDDKSLIWQVAYSSFAEKLLDQLQRGDSLGGAFTAAKQFIQNNPKFFDGQTPWLDDNNNGRLAEKVYLVQTMSHAVIKSELEVHPRIALKDQQISTTIWTKVIIPTHDKVHKVRAILVRPNFVNTEYQGMETNFAREEVELIYNAAQDRYEIVYDKFFINGIWNIIYQVKNLEGFWYNGTNGEVEVNNVPDKVIKLSLNKSSYKQASEQNLTINVYSKDSIDVKPYLAMILPNDGGVKRLIYPNNEFGKANQIKPYIPKLKINQIKTYYLKPLLPEETAFGDYMFCGILVPEGEAIKMDGSNWLAMDCTGFKVQ